MAPEQKPPTTMEELRAWTGPQSLRSEYHRQIKQDAKIAKRLGAPPTHGKIASWTQQRREAFQRDVIAQQLSLKTIAAKYSVTITTIQKYKKNYLLPAVQAAQQNNNLELQGAAQRTLSWLIDETKASIGDLRHGRKEADGTVVRADPKAYGTVEQLLGRAHDMARSIGETTGELKTGAAPHQESGRQIIKVISLPKVAGTPEFAMSIEQGGPDYDHMKLVDVDAEG